MKQGRFDLFDVKMEGSSSSKIFVKGSTKIILKPTRASQPQKEQDKQSTQGAQVAKRKLQPEWLGKFYNRTFFGYCPKHSIFKNELNKYCIDCDAELCQYCVILGSHSSHRILKIYRHVFTNVVPVKEITLHIDCKKIQPYRCNRQSVLALTPLPHLGSQTNPKTTCRICNRRLIEYCHYNYCSISCKVKAFERKKSDSAPPFLLLDETKQNREEGSSSKKIRKTKGNSAPPSLLCTESKQNTEEGSSSKRTRKRKGTPNRAPFF